MTPIEGETTVLAVAALGGAVIAVAREAVRRNWVSFSVSLSVTKPDARWPKFPKPAETRPRPAPVPGAGFTGAGGARQPAVLRDAEATRREYARLRADGISTTEVAVALSLRGGTRSRYERRYQQDRQAASGHGQETAW